MDLGPGLIETPPFTKVNAVSTLFWASIIWGIRPRVLVSCLAPFQERKGLIVVAESQK
jgi:hypothetical protein